MNVPVAAVEQAFDTLREADRLIASALAVLAHADVEAATNMPAEFGVRFEARRTSWEAREMLGVADALPAMPRLRLALHDGLVSFSQCRAIVRAMRDVHAADRGSVDELIERRAPALRRADPDGLVREVEDLCARLRADLERKREQRRIEASFLVLRPKLDGGGSLYGEADAERFTSIAEALETSAEEPAEGVVRARQHMDALVGICESSLAGGSKARPRPRMLVTFDLERMATDGGKLLWPLPGKTPRLTPLSIEVAACDAKIEAIAFDAGVPVAASGQRDTVPAKVRAAVFARDKGCRFPGCGAPLAWSDVHHARWRSAGGSNDVDNLIVLCRRCHRRAHHQLWSIALRPDGTAEFGMRGRRWISTPRE